MPSGLTTYSTSKLSIKYAAKRLSPMSECLEPLGTPLSPCLGNYIWQTAIRKFFLIWSQKYPSSCLLLISPCFNYWCQAAKTFSSKSQFFKKLKTTVKYLSSFSSSKYDIMIITSTILISLPWKYQLSQYRKLCKTCSK